MKWRAMVACLGVILCGAAARGQEPVDPSEWRRGYHGFATLCRAVDLQPTDDPAAWFRVPPQRSLLVVFGSVARLPVNLESYLRRGGAVLVASDRGDAGVLDGLGVDLMRGPHEAVRRDAALHGYRDCPLVTEFAAGHPLTEGLRSIATNRPGAVFLNAQRPGPGLSRPRVLARLPVLEFQLRHGFRRSATGPPFLVSLESAAGGRAAILADQSMFANQMLFYGDNARLAANALRWLGEGRTTVLILDDRDVVVPPSPEQVEIEIPPRSPREVREALRHLPPGVLVDFGNTVATAVEDDGIADEILTDLIRRIAPHSYYRLLVLIASVTLGALVARRLLAHTAADAKLGDRRQAAVPLSRRVRVWRERQQAAAALLDRFRADVAGPAAGSWEAFAQGLRLAGRPWGTRRLRRQVIQAARRLGPEGFRYWTRRRLRRLDERIGRWRSLHATGALEYETGGSRGRESA